MYSRSKAWNQKYNEKSVTYEVRGSDQFSTRFWFLIISHLIVSVSHILIVISSSSILSECSYWVFWIPWSLPSILTCQWV